jgi:hypothetical protein
MKRGAKVKRGPMAKIITLPVPNAMAERLAAYMKISIGRPGEDYIKTSRVFVESFGDGARQQIDGMIAWKQAELRRKLAALERL